MTLVEPLDRCCRPMLDGSVCGAPSTGCIDLYGQELLPRCDEHWSDSSGPDLPFLSLEEALTLWVMSQ